MNCEIIKLTDQPELKEIAAQWFHEKWGIPLEAYTESMTECLTRKHAVPQWYMAMEDQRIIGGLGVIENDFHNRRDRYEKSGNCYLIPYHRPHLLL